jgi:multidrug transporter EmrE-like cation transporter
MHWVLLGIGIAIEICATAALKLSDGFTRSFALAFYVMSVVVRTMPVGIAYSVWAGGGIAGVTLLGAVAFGQKLDGFAYLGVGLILAGVVVLNALSGAASG